MQHIIAQADSEDAARTVTASKEARCNGKRLENGTAILICTHAAPLIAIGRTLTGKMPADICEEDFKTYTCGISKFQRRKAALENDRAFAQGEALQPVAQGSWRDGRGVAGGWGCVTNSDCTHLEGGEERGWLVPRFSYALSMGSDASQEFYGCGNILDGISADTSIRHFNGDEAFESAAGTSSKL